VNGSPAPEFVEGNELTAFFPLANNAVIVPVGFLAF
jgi:hypothetical protein